MPDYEVENKPNIHCVVIAHDDWRHIMRRVQEEQRTHVRMPLSQIGVMHDFNRDLLVLSDISHLTRAEINRHLNMLNAVLYHIENWDAFCAAHEIININRHKIICKPHLIQRILHEKELKAFVFVCNRN